MRIKSAYTTLFFILLGLFLYIKYYGLANISVGNLVNSMSIKDYNEALNLNIIIAEYENEISVKTENKKNVYSEAYLTRGMMQKFKVDEMYYSDFYVLQFNENGITYDCSNIGNTNTFKFAIGDNGDTLTTNGACITVTYVPTLITFLNSKFFEVGRLKLKKRYEYNLVNKPNVSLIEKLKVLPKTSN